MLKNPYLERRREEAETCPECREKCLQWTGNGPEEKCLSCNHKFVRGRNQK